MTDIREQLHGSDPVCFSALEKLSSAAVFDELFHEIVTRGDEDFESLPDRQPEETHVAHLGARRWAKNRRLVLAVVSSAAVLLLLAALLAAPGQRTPGRRAPGRTSQPAGHPRSARVARPWRLVGDISTSWRMQPSRGFQVGLFLTCPTASTCYANNEFGSPTAAAQVEVTYDGGGTWQQLDLPVTLSDATRLVCVNGETCAVLGIDTSGAATFLETTDGGKTWATSRGPNELTSPASVADLSCWSATSCVVIASDPSGETGAAAAYSTVDGGDKWTWSPLPQNFVPAALQCVGPSVCATVGFLQSPEGTPSAPPAVAFSSSDGGLTWTKAPLPPTSAALTQLSCPTVSDCVATFFDKPGSAQTVLISHDGGRSWNQTGSSPQAYISGLSCPSASDCWASGTLPLTGPPTPVPILGSRGAISSTTDGGSTWQSAQLPSGTGPIVDVSCPTVSNCYAIALQHPRPWTAPSAPSDHGPFTAVLLADGS